MEDIVERALNVDVVSDIVLHKTEAGIPEVAGDVIRPARQQVVHTDDIVTFVKKAVGQVGPNKAGTTGDEYAHAIPYL